VDQAVPIDANPNDAAPQAEQQQQMAATDDGGARC